MEQQTITIAKAGIHATLNARASVLAGANPTGGRYDKAKSLKYNVNISPPIMSRFDLFYILFDNKQGDLDAQIATHLVNMHRFKGESIKPDFKMQEI